MTTDCSSDSLPTSPETLLLRLDALGIVTTTYYHPPVFTVDESKSLCRHLPGGHCKSLFLQEKQSGSFWLVVALAAKRLDLKRLSTQLAIGRLSFAKTEHLWQILGVPPGAVTPFALINDTAHQVVVILDRRMMHYPLLNYHPLVNDRTTSIRRDDFVTFLTAYGYDPRVIDLEETSCIDKREESS